MPRSVHEARGSSSTPGKRDLFELLILFSPVLIAAISPGGAERITLMLVLSWVFVARRFRFVVDWVFLAGIGLIGISLPGLVLAVDLGYSVRVAATVALAILYVQSIRSYFAAHQQLRPFGLVALWAAGLLHSIYFALASHRRLPTQLDPFGRSALESVNANVSGWIIAVGVWAGLFLVLYWRARLPTRLAWAISFTLLLMAAELLATGSRASLLSAAAGIAALAFARIPRYLHTLTISAWALAVVISLNPTLLRNAADAISQLPVIAEFSMARGIDGLNGRGELWEFMHDYAISLPLYGLGYGSYRPLLSVSFTAHNFVLEAWTGVGLIGLVLSLVWLGGLLLAPRGLRQSDPTYGSALVLSSSAFVLLLPTLMASTQYWTAGTAAILGIAAVTSVQPRRKRLWQPNAGRLDHEPPRYSGAPRPILWPAAPRAKPW